jgi:cephalosporin hydroxylase
MLLDAFNLVPSRRAPFLSRRYPYRDREAMMRALGPDLRTEVKWPASNVAVTGDLATVFFNTSDVHKWEHYLLVYESVIDRSRPINMLEIGVFHGGSLRMWRQYLHPDSTIVGVDIDPDCQKFHDPARGVHVRIGSQQDTDFLQTVIDEYGPFDVILDDGSHLSSHMVETFQFLFPHALADDGVYIVEDIHCNYWKGWRDRPGSFVDFTKTLIDAMHAHYQLNQSEVAFRVDDPGRRANVTVPLATTLVGRIEFFDSIAIVHRTRRELPRCFYR